MAPTTSHQKRVLDSLSAHESLEVLHAVRPKCQNRGERLHHFHVALCQEGRHERSH